MIGNKTDGSKESFLYIKTTSAQKGRWKQAAVRRGQNIETWSNETLDKEAARETQETAAWDAAQPDPRKPTPKK